MNGGLEYLTYRLVDYIKNTYLSKRFFETKYWHLFFLRVIYFLFIFVVLIRENPKKSNFLHLEISEKSL
ncbi:MAG: hypothetical protein ACD_78C00356G0003 [uncultured bacterium (gcode 4)]|uniref:Uncharacterized protein n=1 Tax=uncultured bacterium (gcode 4) TaxID=1234023 RepID=K1XWD7_9BACT|nr:MAG: hypothetical protein ACD_78C00356G0003 [uncultured bacterium (gcode 4)]